MCKLQVGKASSSLRTTIIVVQVVLIVVIIDAVIVVVRERREEGEEDRRGDERSGEELAKAFVMAPSWDLDVSQRHQGSNNVDVQCPY